MEALWLSIAIAVLGFLVVAGAFYVPRHIAMRVVAAVYRTSLGAAETLGGLEWLRSEDGVAYRKMLVRRAYALLPHPVGPVPWKLFISEEYFCRIVELAFCRMLELAEKLAVPADTAVAQ